MATVIAVWRRFPWVVPLVGAVVVVLLPAMGISSDLQRQVMLVSFLALLVSGLNLSLGFAGELALGQVAMYAAGAYISGYMGSHGDTDILLQLVVSAAFAVVVGLLTGIPGLRLGSWSLAMTSFFLVLLIPDILEIFSTQTGGHLGLTGIAPPTLFGVALSPGGFYVVVTVVTALWLLAMRNLVTSRHGTAFRVLRQSPVLASSLGISVYRMKLTAYAVGALPAGLAGCLFANLDHFLSPTSFNFTLSITILAASILGGSTSVYGAVVGAIILQVLPEQFTTFSTYSQVIYGVFLIVGGVLLGGGIAGLCRRGVRWLERRTQGPVAPPAADVVALPAIPGKALAAEDVGKSFGGLRALHAVNLTALQGQVTALIGPNGSGKTTLLNVICGYYRLDEGAIVIGGEQRPQREQPHRVARAGVARTFQTANIPAGITVAEVVRSGRYTTDRSSMLSAILRLPGAYRVKRRDDRAAAEVMAQVGISHLADQEAAALPLGTRRMLEVARSLVRAPGVLLLDEAASGLDEDEVERLALLIRKIRDAGGTVILVEHNFRLVLSLADQIVVLAEGQVIATGTPAEIETHPRVLQEYLGVKPTVAAELMEDATREAAEQSARIDQAAGRPATGRES
ncbi:MAG TPA: branched-chain amino acid ABC transporter ATP-binding protein/permease [Acidimicrobiales bacterium]|nr:branched-chain amino acid ABC transporter ATP-binding protein/permease [Acidimicrobiales bacterium]